MAKCPKCSSRKGKRHCPGLDAMICSACCGEYRHSEIDCPEDCVYLGQESVHQKRRMEKARSQGRHFLKFLTGVVRNELQWQFALRLFLHMFAYNQRHGTLTDAEVCDVLNDLKRALGPILLPGPPPHPLSVEIEGLTDEDLDLATKVGFSEESRVAVLEALLVAISGKRGDGTRRVGDLLESFFGPLDLEADLGYSGTEAGPPGRAGARLESGFRERPSGLIVPP